MLFYLTYYVFYEEDILSTIAIHSDNKNLFTAINNTFIDEYMAEAHGDYIKVYIYLIRLFSSSDKSFDTKNVARALDITESDLIKAIKYWNKKGLIHTIIKDDEICSIDIVSLNSPSINTNSMPKKEKPAAEVLPFSIVPKKKAFDADLFEKYSSDDDFMIFAKIVGKYFNRNLNSNDMAILIDLIDNKKMSYEILEFLVEQLANSGIKTVKTLENKALTLHENNITNLEDAKAFYNNSSKKYANIFRKLVKKGEDFQVYDDDIFIIDKWIYDYQMPYDLIYLACKRTNKFLKSKNLQHKINYTNRILENWYHKGIKTTAEAEMTFTDTNNKGKKLNLPKDQHDYDFDSIMEQNFQELEERLKQSL